ncbi:MAG: DNA modification system-associated small protein [Pseudomonadota bacterium]
MDDEYSESPLSDLPLWGDEAAQAVLEAVCLKYNVPMQVITELVTVQRERQHQEKARGINPRFEEILGAIE